jgi:hypothetical protein
VQQGLHWGDERVRVWNPDVQRKDKKVFPDGLSASKTNTNKIVSVFLMLMSLM